MHSRLSCLLTLVCVALAAIDLFCRSSWTSLLHGECVPNSYLAISLFLYYASSSCSMVSSRKV